MKKFLVCCLVASGAWVQPVEAQDITVNIENEVVQRYLSEVEYTREMESEVTKYVVDPPQRCDIPNPAVIAVPEVDADTVVVVWSKQSDLTDGWCQGVGKGSREALIYNLVPQQKYYYQVLAEDSVVAAGNINPQGQLRMIYAPSIRNIRDLGGWVNNEGRQIKYEKLYRGRELNGQNIADSVDIATLRELGIEAEIDMRYDGENDGAGISAFGFLSSAEVGSGEQPTYLFTDNSGCCEEKHLTLYYWRQRYRQEFEFMANSLREGRPVYFHCIWGADRTGMLAILLEGMLGISYSDMVKDLELTSFSDKIITKGNREFIFDYFDRLTGTTLQEKIRYYLTNMVGVNRTVLDYLYEELLEKGTTVGIDEVSGTDGTVHAGTYNLHGQRLSNAQQKGLQIVVDETGHSRKTVQR